MMGDAQQSAEVQSKILFLKVCTVVPLSILHYLRATISHVIIEKKVLWGLCLHVIVYITYNVQSRPCFWKNEGKPCPTFVLQQQN